MAQTLFESVRKDRWKGPSASRSRSLSDMSAFLRRIGARKINSWSMEVDDESPFLKGGSSSSCGGSRTCRMT